MIDLEVYYIALHVMSGMNAMRVTRAISICSNMYIFVSVVRVTRSTSERRTTGALV